MKTKPLFPNSGIMGYMEETRFSKVSSHDRRVTVPPDAWRSLCYCAEDEQGKIVDPIVRATVTPEGIAVNAIIDYLTKMKHYPPKDKMPVTADDDLFDVEQALKKTGEKKPPSDIMIGS
jgi:hypothetical protein